MAKGPMQLPPTAKSHGHLSVVLASPVPWREPCAGSMMGIFAAPAVFFPAGSPVKPFMTMTSTSLTGLAMAAALMLAACADSAEPKPAELPIAPTTMEMEIPAPVNDMPVEGQAPLGAQLNPAHGEPGHRCEIPVGAPLDGSGAAPTTVTMPPASAVTMPPGASPVASPVTTPVSGSGKLNPAHGEPGHDCAVPVGSPLPG